MRDGYLFQKNALSLSIMVLSANSIKTLVMFSSHVFDQDFFALVKTTFYTF